MKCTIIGGYFTWLGAESVLQNTLNSGKKLPERFLFKKLFVMSDIPPVKSFEPRKINVVDVSLHAKDRKQEK